MHVYTGLVIQVLFTFEVINFNGEQCNAFSSCLVSSASPVIDKCPHLHCLREAEDILRAELIICQRT